MCRVYFILLTLYISSVLMSQVHFNNITIQIYKGNNTSTLIQTITIRNETLITDIIIANEDVPILKAGTFEGLFVLRTIKIQRTNLAILEEHVFDGLRRIKIINLSFNEIQHVPANVFKNIAVYAIALKGNGIKTISENAFFNLYYLKNLDLSNNNIELLPRNLFVHTSNLKYLNLNSNKLRHFPAVPYRPYSFFDVAFANTVANESSILDLSNNNFTFISYYLLRGIHYLQDLRLNDNDVQLISEYAFDDFKSIKKLHLEGNNLQEISDGLLGVLTTVQNIILDNNPWKEKFACKYRDWCGDNNKTNFMDVKCSTK